MKKLILYIFLIAVLLPAAAYSQAGMKFTELAIKLEPYFDTALILDIKKELPASGDYSIWGWDVGDFSGDGYFDVALTVKHAADKNKIVQVYLFVDIDGYLTKVGQFPYLFVELPLEIGVVIKNNVCYATKKNKQFDWEIIGYTYDNGSLVLHDEYTTKRVSYYTHEGYRNFITLRNTEKFLVTKNGKVEFFTQYLTVPSYTRGRKIYKGYAKEAYSNTIEFVVNGAYNWEGQEDASFKISSAFDEDFLYMTVDVIDDAVVTQGCDTCSCDKIDLWLEVYFPREGETRFTTLEAGPPRI